MSHDRASGNGTAGTATAVPFLREKKNCVAWILTRMLYRITSLSGLPYLGMSIRSSLDIFKSSCIQSSDQRIEVSMAILECETSVELGRV